MTHLDPVMLDALQAAIPKGLSSAERGVLQKKIESLIETLHPDGLEAAEILAAITASVESRYDNKMICIARIQQAHEDLRRAYEKAYESEEGC